MKLLLTFVLALCFARSAFGVSGDSGGASAMKFQNGQIASPTELSVQCPTTPGTSATDCQIDATGVDQIRITKNGAHVSGNEIRVCSILGAVDGKKLVIYDDIDRNSPIVSAVGLKPDACTYGAASTFLTDSSGVNFYDQARKDMWTLRYSAALSRWLPQTTIYGHPLLSGTAYGHSDTLAQTPANGQVVASSGNVWTVIAPNASATRKFLEEDSNTAAWSALTAGDITAATGATGTGASPQVAFWTTSTNLSGDNALSWDNTNKRLYLGATTAPGTAALHVLGNGTQIARITAFNTAAVPVMQLYGSRGTAPTTGGAVASGDILGQLEWFGDPGTLSASAPQVIIQALADENFTGTTRGTHLDFAINPIGSSGAVQVMKLADDGSLLIGTTTKTAGVLLSVASGVRATGTVTVTSAASPQFSLLNASGGRSTFTDGAHAANLDYTLPTAIVGTGVLQVASNGVQTWNATIPAELGAALHYLYGGL
jgi:hypothetical protein